MRRMLSALLFLSGATGLVYEVVWSKVLSDVLGNSGQAHAIVLATFMGGLALGAWLFGGLADRLDRPLMLYAAIELFVGLYALAFPAVHGALESVFLSIAPWFSEDARAFPKLLFAALSLLPPTVAMGGTMPAMLKHATRADPSIRATLAHLYAVNSLGACVGAWLAGTVWIPNGGLWATSRAAGALNLLLAAVSFALARRATEVAPAEVPVETRPDSTRRAVLAALVGLSVSGFTAMLFETGWIRLLTLIVGASTYAFTWIVTAFILGIAVGSFWIARQPEGDNLKLFGRLQTALVVTICFTLPLYIRTPYVFLRLRSMLARTVEAFPAWQGLLFVVSLGVMLLPTVVMGAAFPVGARIVARGHATVGKRVGLVWAVNTIGTVLGALLGGLWLMPWLGVEALFTLGMILTLCGAGAAMLALEGPWRKLAPLGAGVAAFAIYLGFFTGWAPILARLSPFRANLSSVRLTSHSDYLRQYADSMTQDFVRDDTFATVFVGHSTKNPAHRFLLVNGKPDASTGSGDQVTQTLLGELGPLLVPQHAKKVMIVGAGAGVSLASSLAHPIEHADLVEISPAVLEAARLFSDVNHHALDDPRVTIHVDDARTFLELSREKYDVIVSEPSNPWVSGISSLFTREFFAIVDQRLAEGGVLVQWIHTYEMSDDLVRLVLRTLLERFPHTTGWQGGDGDLLLLASRQPLQVDFAELERRLALPSVKEDLGRIHVEGIDAVLALELLPTGELTAFAGQGVLNADAHNLLEYRAPLAFFADLAANVPDARKKPSAWPHLELSRWLALHPLDAVRARRLFAAVSAGQLPDEPLRRSSARAWLGLAPDDASARLALAQVALWQSEPDVTRRVIGEPRTLEEASLFLDADAEERDHLQSPWRELAPIDFERISPLVRGDAAAEELLRAVCARSRCGPTP